MKHMVSGANLALLVGRQNKSGTVDSVFVTKLISEMKSSERTIQSYHFPLYIYPDNDAQPTLDGRTERVPNLNSEIVEKLAAGIGLTFVAEKGRTTPSAEAAATPPKTGGELSESGSPPVLGGVDATPLLPEEGWPKAGVVGAGGRGGQVLHTFAPIDILDYIYAVLHSPTYRKKYKEFLKIDFPRVPYPRDAATFWQLVAVGGELRQIHLLESPVVNRFITSFNVGGDNIVEKVAFVPGSPPYEGGVAAALGGRGGSLSATPHSVLHEASTAASENHPVGETPTPLLRKEGSRSLGRVYFNETQYFANVPETAWNFYIGGYQPAQKWLKDRKGRQLNFDDIQHYQKIIVALTETDRIMKEIDKIEFIDATA